MSDIKIKPENRELADKFKAALAIDETGTATGADDLFEEYLESKGRKLEDVKELNKLTNTFLGSVHLAMGEVSIDKMKENKEIDQTYLTVPMAGNKADVTFRRTAEVSDGKGGRMVKHGLGSIKYRQRITLTNEKAHLSQLAEAALKG